MDRARRAALTALIVVAMIAAAGGSDAPGRMASLAATVGWPPSTLVVSEVQTGGASASDEFIEIANQGTAPTDLLGPGGGLRDVLGQHGDAQGDLGQLPDPRAGPAPAPGERLGRLYRAGRRHVQRRDRGDGRRGGASGRRRVGDRRRRLGGRDQRVRGRCRRPCPAGGLEHRAGSGRRGRQCHRHERQRRATGSSSRFPRRRIWPHHPCRSFRRPRLPRSRRLRVETASPSPLPTPTPLPSPSPTPAPTPTPAATPTPAPTPVAIAQARAALDGTIVTVQGVLTTALGALESGRSGFVQDDTGGIAVYLDATVVGSWPAGTAVTIRGTVGSRFAQRTLRAAESAVERGVRRRVAARPGHRHRGRDRVDRGSTGHRHGHGLRTARQPGRRARRSTSTTDPGPSVR